MDPNEVLKCIQWELVGKNAKNPDFEQIKEYGRTLRGWIRRGGFAPDWAKCPEAAEYFKTNF